MKKMIIGLFITFLSIQVFAADPDSPANNPANVMNALNQTLPSGQNSNQSEFQTTSNAQYIHYAESVKQKIMVKQVELVDAKVIPASVQKVSQSLVGEKVSFKEVQQLAAAVEKAYRNAGFILVQVILPPQEIDPNAGVIKLQVINGEIKHIIFTGDDPRAAKTQLERYAYQVEIEDPISYHSIDRFLTLANQLPGIQVTATLTPDKQVPQAADLIVQVKEKPVAGFINANNRGTQYIGPYQSSVGVSLYDLFGADSVNAVGATSLNSVNQMRYGSLGYDIVIGPYATEINPSVTQTLTQPGGSLNNLGMSGVSTKYNLNVNQPLYSSAQQNLVLQTAFYHVDSNNNLYGDELQLFDDHVTALSLGLNYRGLWWQTYHDVTFSATTGMPILGTPTTLSDPSVVGAQTTFVHFNLATSSVRYITQRTSVALSSQVQYSPNTLVSSEQIGYGGQQFGQAYTPYIISGNSGVMGSLALRYDLPLYWNFTLLQPEIFYDPGMVFYNTIPGTNNSNAVAQSAGIGLNMQWMQNVSATLTLAKPISITQTPGTNMSWGGFFNVTLMM